MEKILSIFILAITFAVAVAIVGITTTVVEAEQEQIIINSDNIKDLTAFGETDKPWYPENYPPIYLFDNLVNSWSFWTQQGNAGFDLELKEKLPDDKKVCTIELGVFQPSNTPFIIKVNDDDSKVVNGTLDNEKVSVNLADSNNNCISEFEKLSIRFNPVDPSVWTTLAEVKLFSEDQILEPNPAESNVTKIIISNSKVEMDLNDSEVTINTDGEKSKVKTVEKEEREDD